MTSFKLIVLFLVALCIPAVAQNISVTATPITDSDVQLLRQDLQADKNTIIEHTMAFTKEEAAAFWPVYEQYAKEQQAIANHRLDLMTEYAKSLDNLTDAKARAMTERLFTVEADTVALRQKFLPRFEKALGARRAAKFYQVDNRLSMMINLQLASMVPLVP